MNKKYGHLENGVLVYAKNKVVIDGRTYVCPRDASYLRCSPPEKLIKEDAPTDPAPAGKHWTRIAGYDETETELHSRWSLVDDAKPTLQDYDTAMERHLAEERSERGYTTREPDAYMSSSNPRWAQDAQDWVAHRDAVMEYALALINAVQSGQREPPTMDEFIAGLPSIVWTFDEAQEESESS